MTDFVSSRIRIQGQLEIGIDADEGNKWVAETINHARNIMNVGMRDGPQTGREYLRGSKIHTASKAGQWPAVDTGNLRINTRMRIDGLVGELGSNVEYAGYLQSGTSKMGARKLYNEAVEAAADDMADGLADVLFVRISEDAQ